MGIKERNENFCFEGNIKEEQILWWGGRGFPHFWAQGNGHMWRFEPDLDRNLVIYIYAAIFFTDTKLTIVVFISPFLKQFCIKLTSQQDQVFCTVRDSSNKP